MGWDQSKSETVPQNPNFAELDLKNKFISIVGSLFDALISANGEHITYYCCDFLSQVTCTFLIFLESPKMKFEFFEMLCYSLFFIFNYCLGQKWIANTYQGR